MRVKGELRLAVVPTEPLSRLKEKTKHRLADAFEHIQKILRV